MIQLNPPGALFQGTLYFRNPVLKQKIRTRGTLFTTLRDFRFHFNGEQYYYLLGTKISGSCRGENPIGIHNFFIQEIREEATLLYYVAFNFRLMDRIPGQTYQVDGILTAGEG